MKLAGDYVFEAPRETVWESLLDPEVLASVLPGCEKLELTGENQYEAALKIKVGPVQGNFKGKVEIEDVQPPSSYTMKIDGRGAPGFVNATAGVQLTEEGGSTRMTYDSDAKVGGRIASVGQRLLDSSAKAIIKQSLEGLNAVMVARTQAEDAGAGAEEAQAAALEQVEAPTQAEFAATVAKEVVKDVVPGKGRLLLIIVGILVILALIWLLT